MKTDKRTKDQTNKMSKHKIVIHYLICLAGALLLYTIVAFNQRNDKVFSCRLRIEGLNADDFVITNTLPDVIRVTVKDKQNVLDSITEEDFNVHLDLSGINEQNNYTLPIEWDMPKAFQHMRNSMLFSTVELNPAKITVNIENIQQKSVPIQINTKGLPADGYIIHDQQLDINYIRIQGPAGVINDIQSVRTEAINIEKAIDSIISQDVSLISPSPLVTFVGKSNAKVTIRIVKDIENVTFTYNAVEINNLKKFLKAEYHIDDKIAVTISGDKKTLESLQKTSIILSVDCRNISYQGEYSTRINVNPPMNVTLVSVKPDVLKLTITEIPENMTFQPRHSTEDRRQEQDTEKPDESAARGSTAESAATTTTINEPSRKGWGIKKK
ncbi:MAG: YbbR-like domain-containing protein [Spirochaetales bacterium]|nr:YbbR-like domain-containing protein [Spirochaetales bacterium]MBR6199228.1 YbbR-like domain-containing protein [Spirochaetales bacterium]